MENLVGESGEQGAAAERTGAVHAYFGAVVGDITAMAQQPENRPRPRKAAPPHAHMQDREESKRRGEIAESMFLTKAATMGYSIATPWGDSDKYDLIVDTGSRLFRVQVKSAFVRNKSGGYRISAHRRHDPYRPSEIDLLVAHVVPQDAWYVFPPRAFQTMKQIALYPKFWRTKSKYEKYRDAWDLFEL